MSADETTKPKTGEYGRNLVEFVGDGRLRELECIDAEAAEHAAHLNSDTHFIRRTNQIGEALQSIYDAEPDAIRYFFRWFGVPTLKRLPEIHEFVDILPQHLEVRETFVAYARYVDRFRMYLRFRDKSPHFVSEPLMAHGFALSGKISKSKRSSKKAKNRRAMAVDCEVRQSSLTDVPEILRALVESKSIKYVHLDDDDGSSVLSRQLLQRPASLEIRRLSDIK